MDNQRIFGQLDSYSFFIDGENQDFWNTLTFLPFFEESFGKDLRKIPNFVCLLCGSMDTKEFV
jgi:hypothetical protein